MTFYLQVHIFLFDLLDIFIVRSKFAQIKYMDVRKSVYGESSGFSYLKKSTEEVFDHSVRFIKMELIIRRKCFQSEKFGISSK